MAKRKRGNKNSYYPLVVLIVIILILAIIVAIINFPIEKIKISDNDAEVVIVRNTADGNPTSRKSL